MNREALVRSYLDRIAALEAERRNALTLAELQEVARDLGLSDADLADAEAARRAHLERGNGFLRYGRWDDAITELRSASVLDPTDVNALHALAGAYAGRWLEKNDDRDRREAAEIARRTLQIAPTHEPSFVLLRDLDHASSPAPDTTGRSRSIFLLLIGVIAAALLLLFFIAQPDPGPVPIAPPAIPAPPHPASLAGSVSFRLMPTEQSRAMTFVTTDERSDQRSQGMAYSFQGQILSDARYSRLRVKVEVLDASGTLLGTVSLEATPEGGAPTGVFTVGHAFPELPGKVWEVRIWVEEAA